MRSIRLSVFLAALLPLLCIAMPGRAWAASQTAPTGTHWTLCVDHLDWVTMTHVTATQCYQVPMPRETRKPIGQALLRTVRLSPHVSERVLWPSFPAPVYALPGCPPAIAQWAADIISASRQTGVSVRAITGIIAIESGGNPNAYNPASGASGLGQFLPSTAAALGVNPWLPSSAIMGIARYYRMAGATAYSGGGYGDGLIYARGCD